MRKLKTHELGRKSPGQFEQSQKLPITVILDDLRSMHNVGAVFRTSDAFLAEQIFLCGITACPPHRQISKVAIGATETVSWTYFNDVVKAVSQLKNDGYTIIGIEQTDRSVPLEKFQTGVFRKTALIFGNEVNGINDQLLPLLDHAIEIPQEGTKHSLNVGVSVGIVLWEFFKGFQG